MALRTEAGGMGGSVRSLLRGQAEQPVLANAQRRCTACAAELALGMYQ